MRLLLATAALCALLFPISQFRAADSLPSELSNDAFRTIISEMSESEVAFQYASNNFVSNELYYQTVIPLVPARTKPGGVYMGVGPEQNFTYIAAFRPQMAFIIDIRRQNLLELLMYKALFEMAPNRADFVSLLFSRPLQSGGREATPVDDLLARYRNIPPDAKQFQANLDAIEDRLINLHKLPLSPDDVAGILKVYSAFRDEGLALNFNSGASGLPYGITFEDLMVAGDTQGHADPGSRHSFLSTEEDYRYVRSMQQKNLIVPLVGDFGGPKTVRAVGAYAREHGGIVNVFYISNVTGYLNLSSQFDAFIASARTLPLDQSSTFIRGADRPGLGMDRVPAGITRGMFSSIVPILEVLEGIRQGQIRLPTDMNKISR